jgi:hypothetical protein
MNDAVGFSIIKELIDSKGLLTSYGMAMKTPVRAQIKNAANDTCP